MICEEKSTPVERDNPSTLASRRIAFLRPAACLPQDQAEIDLERIRNAKQRVDGGKPLAFLHAHDHRMTKPRAGGDFVQGKLLPQTFCLKQFDQPGNNCLTVGSFRHITLLCDEMVDSGCDYRHNRVINP